MIVSIWFVFFFCWLMNLHTVVSSSFGMKRHGEGGQTIEPELGFKTLS